MAGTVRRQLRDDESMAGEQALHLVAIGIALGRLLDVEDRRIEGRQLHRPEALLGSPGRERVEAIEGWLRRDELRQEHAGTIYGFHVACLFVQSDDSDA